MSDLSRLRLLEINGYIAVRCHTCNSDVGDPCRKGGPSWPQMASRPHRRRREDALLVRWWIEFGEAAQLSDRREASA